MISTAETPVEHCQQVAVQTKETPLQDSPQAKNDGQSNPCRMLGWRTRREPARSADSNEGSKGEHPYKDERRDTGESIDRTAQKQLQGRRPVATSEFRHRHSSSVGDSTNVRNGRKADVSHFAVTNSA